MRVLVTEDERKVAHFIVQGLRAEGHTVETATDGDTALELLCGDPRYDLAVLDITLPKRDGFAVVKGARELGVQTPVLMVTARDAVADKVTALDLGADDYLTKPFALDEFLARVRALLRRGTSQRAPILRSADLALDPATRQVTRGGRAISLSPRQYSLLEYFLRNPGRVLTRATIAEHVWGPDLDPESNLVDVYVGYLRRKIDRDDRPRLFQTVRGIGYMLGSQD
jgi:DNA-binding response OmpR family regulator